MLHQPVGGTVTMWQPCVPVDFFLQWLSGVASATLYLSSLRSFHGWEKITVFADDNAIN